MHKTLKCSIVIRKGENNDKHETKEFLLSMLKHAEINIQDYEFKTNPGFLQFTRIPKN